MKPLGRFRWLLPVLIVTLGCNTLVRSTAVPTRAAPIPPTLTPTNPPPASATPVPVTPSPTPVPLPALTSLVDNLNTRIAAGEWTYETGLVTSLKFLVGEASATDLNPSGRQIINYEGSSIARRANAYIQNGSDQPTKIELTRLLNLLFPDPAKIDKYAVPATSHNPLPSFTNANFQTENCRTLWAEGFPADRTTPCLEVRTVEVSGHVYKIYVPKEWAATADSRLALIEPTAQAISDAINTYLTYGEMPASGTFVFSLLQVDPRFDMETTESSAGGPCRITSYPSATATTDIDYFKQVVAHEMFHCFEYEQNPTPMLADSASGDWWMEGAAEFFSNVVYPDTNAEYDNLPPFDDQSPTKPLIDFDYPAFIFFQYLADQKGNEAVSDLIKNMPDSNQRPAQAQALSDYPEIDTLFHDFAQAYVDGSVKDTNGDFIPRNLRLADSLLFDSTITYTLPTPNFVVNRQVLVFPKGTEHALTELDKDDLVSSAALLSGSDWTPLPQSVVAACDLINYIYVITGTDPADDTLLPKISSQVTEKPNSCDPCLIGKWTMDNDSFWATIQSLVPANVRSGLTLIDLSGSVSLEFRNNGTWGGPADSFRVEYKQSSQGITARVVVSINGQGEASWSTAQGAGPAGQNVIYNTNVTKRPDIRTDITIGGATTSVPVPPAYGAFGGDEIYYTCEGDTLTLDTFSFFNLSGTPVTYRRQASP